MPILYPFSKSPEKQVTAQKIPTTSGCYLRNITDTDTVEGKTLNVGTSILVAAGVHAKGSWLQKPVSIYHRLNAGAWEKLTTKTAPKDTVDYPYTLTKAGIHTFYSEFAGDDTYEGCSKAVRLSAR